jgi:fermentation-respiration switch protein FrsA (DUF1100 family)
MHDARENRTKSRRWWWRTTIAALLIAIMIAIAGPLWVGDQLIAPARSRMNAPPAALDFAPVSFASPSGAIIAGWYGAGGETCPTIVLMHPLRGNRQAMLGRAAFLARAGYGVLLFDFQAHGESTGERITFGHLERYDATAAIAFAKARRPNARIGVIGISLGGAATLLADPPLPIDALVIESVYPTVEEAGFNRVALRLGPLAHLLTPLLLVQFDWRLGFPPETLRPIDRIGAITAPLYVIAGTDDRHTTLAESRRLFDRVTSPKAFWAVAGAAHVDLHAHAREDYERRVGAFFAQHLPCG